MRRWIIFGVVIMLAFVVVANLAGPSAWAADAHAQDITVPTRTPKPANTPVPPTSKPPKDPTNTPIPAPTDTPVVVQPTSTAIVVQPTRTATAQITDTATVPAETVGPTATSTVVASDQATATATTPVEVTSTATPESAAAATVAVTPTSDNSTVFVPAQSGSAAEQASGAVPADNSSNVWLLISAAALVIFGMVLLFGRRRKDTAK
jgi:cytoskeletal protein RodZ